MKILFIHQNYPAQYKHLAPALAAEGHEIVALKVGTQPTYKNNGVTVVEYQLTRGNGKDTHPLVVDFESKIIRAESCFPALIKLRDLGFYPEVVVGHPGWGETLFIKDIWPNAALKIYCEYWYH